MDYEEFKNIYQTLMMIHANFHLDHVLGLLPCLTRRTSPGGLFSHRPKQCLPSPHLTVVFSGEMRPSPPAMRSTSHCCCWSVKAHSRSSPWAAVERQQSRKELQFLSKLELQQLTYKEHTHTFQFCSCVFAKMKNRHKKSSVPTNTPASHNPVIKRTL